ncbi:hypothetical protein, partial [Acetobacter sp.]
TGAGSTKATTAAKMAPTKMAAAGSTAGTATAARTTATGATAMLGMDRSRQATRHHAAQQHSQPEF